MKNIFQFRRLQRIIQKFRFKRIIGFLLILFMTVQLLSACLNQDITLRFAISEAEKDIWQRVIDQFHEKHPDINIEAIPIRQNDGINHIDQLKKTYVDAFISANTPFYNLIHILHKNEIYDLIYLDIIWVSEFASRDWLKDLTEAFPPDVLKDVKKENFLVSEVENGCYGGKNNLCKSNENPGGGKLYRVPFRTDIGMLYYRKDLLSLGKSPPTTFDDLKNIFKKFKKPENGAWGYLWQGQKSEALVATFIEVLYGFGGSWIREKQENGEIVYEVELDQVDPNNQNIRPAIEAINFLRETITKKISPPESISLDWEKTRDKFDNRQAISMRNWPAAWNQALEPEFKLGGKIDIMPMVHAIGKTSGVSKGGWGFGVAKNSRYPTEAIEAIKFFTSAPIQRQFTLNSSFLPSRRRLFFDPTIVSRYNQYPQLLNWMDVSEGRINPVVWITRPRIPVYTQASCILQNYLSKSLTGNLTPEDAIKKATRQTRELLKAVGDPQELQNIDTIKCDSKWIDD